MLKNTLTISKFIKPGLTFYQLILANNGQNDVSLIYYKNQDCLSQL